jgi:hypothetical protein
MFGNPGGLGFNHAKMVFRACRSTQYFFEEAEHAGFHKSGDWLAGR